VAAKTGTSQAYHDNWTIGYSRHVTVGVWVGNFDRRPLRNSSGVTGAGPIFHAVMLAAERRAAARGDESRLPESVVSNDTGVQSVEICALSGMAANSWCPARRREWIPTETALQACNWHHLTDEGVLTVWPAEYRQWAMDHTEDSPRDHSREAAAVPTTGEAPPASLRIASPPDGATYLIDPTLRREFQTLSLRAVLAVPGPVEWIVDRRSLGTSAADKSIEWPLAPGRHTFVAWDTNGRSAESSITVR
jgi:penicillin-binding protein 1C